MTFSDDEVKRAKETANQNLREDLTHERLRALIARLEAAEKVATAVEDAERVRQTINITNQVSAAFDIIEWFRKESSEAVRAGWAWRKAAGK